MSDRAPLRVIFADDELLARRRIRRLLEAMDDVEIAGEHERGETVIAALDDESIDVALLDVQMPGLTGLDAASMVRGGRPAVVFTTAHREHAVEAFDVGAVDYVVKPIDPRRLRQALDRARARLAALDEQSSKDRDRPPLLALEVRGAIRLVDPRDIEAAVLDGQLVTVHVGGEAILTALSLRELERKLPASALERTHRRALLALEHVDRLIPLESGGYNAVTRSGVEVPVSRGAARTLRRRLGL